MSWSDSGRKPDTERFSEELLENENDRRLENVASKVSTLKHIALDLRSEAKDQVNIIGDSDGLFESATALLSHSFKRVQGMRRTNVVNCKFMCYFALVAVVLLLLFYWLLGHVMA